jgi:rhodanese-related sulfurtransferase
MTTSTYAGSASFRRIDADGLRRRLADPHAPLLLDVRRSAAFGEPPGIPTALPFALDRDPLLLPDLPRTHPIVVYCL